MSKYTIFTLFLTSILLIVVVEFFVSDYINAPYLLDLGANTLQEDTAQSLEDAVQSQQMAAQDIDDATGSKETVFPDLSSAHLIDNRKSAP